MNTSLRIHIKRPAWDCSFRVYMSRPTDAGMAVMQPCVFNVIPRTELGCQYEPAFKLEEEDAQLFMDELWNAGIRPSEGSGSAGAMVAVQAHLKDMQRLVFERPVTPNPNAVHPLCGPDWIKKSVGGISDDGT